MEGEKGIAPELFFRCAGAVMWDQHTELAAESPNPPPNKLSELASEETEPKTAVY